MSELLDTGSSSVTSKELERDEQRRAGEDRRHVVRAVVAAWKKQQNQDRAMRERYAKWLMGAMAFQVLTINVVYLLMGCGLLTFDPWTSRTFIMAVFGEIAALVLLVVKYLFTPSGDAIFRLIDKPGAALKPKRPTASRRASRRTSSTVPEGKE